MTWCVVPAHHAAQTGDFVLQISVGFYSLTLFYTLNCFKMGSSDVICYSVDSCVALHSRKSNV